MGPWGRAVLEPGVAEDPLPDHPKGKSAEEQWSSIRPKKNVRGSSLRGAIALQQMQAEQCLSSSLGFKRQGAINLLVAISHFFHLLSRRAG